jgi:hypothetical protein
MSGDLKVASGLCWNLAQLTGEIEKYDSANEMVKLEVNHDFAPGKRCYHWTLLYMELPPHDDCHESCSDGHTYVDRRCVYAAKQPA